MMAHPVRGDINWFNCRLLQESLREGHSSTQYRSYPPGRATEVYYARTNGDLREPCGPAAPAVELPPQERELRFRCGSCTAVSLPTTSPSGANRLRSACSSQSQGPRSHRPAPAMQGLSTISMSLRLLAFRASRGLPSWSIFTSSHSTVPESDPYRIHFRRS